MRLKIHLEECKNLYLGFLNITYTINKALKVGIRSVVLSHLLTIAEANHQQRHSPNYISEILFFLKRSYLFYSFDPLFLSSPTLIIMDEVIS